MRIINLLIIFSTVAMTSMESRANAIIKDTSQQNPVNLTASASGLSFDKNLVLSNGRLTVGTDAYLDLSGADPILNLDSSDYIYYSRSLNTYVWAIAGAAKMALDSAGILTVNGPIVATLAGPGPGGGSVCSSATGGAQAGTFVWNNAPCNLSSRRFKHDIVNTTLDSDIAYKLRPVEFVYNSEPGKTYFGLIAEEVAEIEPLLATYEDDGKTPHGVQYDKMGVVAIMALRKMKAQYDAQIADLTARLSELEATLAHD